MYISAVIPTRNRPQDLAKAVASIYQQNRLPDELIIVDQSDTNESRDRVEHLHADAGQPLKLKYIHDRKIAGLVEAKRAAINYAESDVVCFLEDDVVLHAGYIQEILSGFDADSEMMGCCGVITNLPELPKGYIGFFHLFHRGIFHDERVGVHGFYQGQKAPMIESNYLSGGLSAYRREVFRQIPFDVVNNFFMLEDIDFSTRAARFFGDRFYINPNAMLEHHMSPVNRAILDKKYRRKVREFILFYKKWRSAPGATYHLLWLLTGLWLEAMLHSLKVRRLSPFRGYFLGVWDGLRWRLRKEEGCQ